MIHFVPMNTRHRLAIFCLCTIAFMPLGTAYAEDTSSGSLLPVEGQTASIPSSGSVLPPDTDEEDEDTTDDTAEDGTADLDLQKNFEGVVRQSKPFNCGPAALATLITQLGDETTEADVSSYAPANPDTGVSLFALKEAAKILGHAAVLKKWNVAQLEQYLKTAEDPVLIHDIKDGVGGHFSVVRDMDSEKDVINVSDTEAGNIRMSVKDFTKAFNGFVLILDPDAEGPLIADATTDVSDDDAKVINGKYVPVYLATAGMKEAVQDRQIFAECMAKAVTLTTASQRNSARAACYATFGAALARDLTKQEDMQVTSVIGASKITTNDPVRNAQNAAKSLSPLALQLRGQRDVLQRAVDGVAAQKNAAQQKLNEAAGKKILSEQKLAAKQKALDAVTLDIKNVALQLGSIKQSIAAQTTNLGNLSKSLQKKMADAQSLLASKQKSMTAINQEIASRQNTINGYNNQIASLQNAMAKKKSKRQSVTSEQNQINGLNAKISAEKNNLSSAERRKQSLQAEIATLAASIQSGPSALSASQQAINALRAKQDATQRDLDRKQAELPRIKSEFAILANDHMQKVAQWTTASTELKTKTDLWSRAIATLNTKQKEFDDEVAFIDAQEQALVNLLAKQATAPATPTAPVAQPSAGAQSSSAATTTSGLPRNWDTLTEPQKQAAQVLLDLGDRTTLPVQNQKILQYVLDTIVPTLDYKLDNTGCEGDRYGTEPDQCKPWLQKLITSITGVTVGNNITKNAEGTTIVPYAWADKESVKQVAALRETGTFSEMIDAANTNRIVQAGDIIQMAYGDIPHTMLIAKIQDNGIWVIDTNFGQLVPTLADKDHKATGFIENNKYRRATEAEISANLATHWLREDNTKRMHFMQFDVKNAAGSLIGGLNFKVKMATVYRILP